MVESQLASHSSSSTHPSGLRHHRAMDAGQTEPPKEQAVSERELELLNKPAVTECPSCGHEGMTRVEKEGSGLAK